MLKNVIDFVKDLTNKHVKKLDAPELQDFEFTADILLFGFMAKYYSEGFSDAPVRNWVYGTAPRPLEINGHQVNMDRGRRLIGGNWLNGVVFTVKYNHSNPGDKTQETFFIPFDELGNVKVQLRGLKE